MGLFSKFGKNKQDAAGQDSGYYSSAADSAALERARTKRASAADRNVDGGGERRSRAKDPAADPVLPEKKRARRRLVGAIALALAVAIGLPMLLDSEPKPLVSDIAIQIPSKDRPADAQDDKRPSRVDAADALDTSEEIVKEGPSDKPAAGKAAVATAAAAAAPLPAAVSTPSHVAPAAAAPVAAQPVSELKLAQEAAKPARDSARLEAEAKAEAKARAEAKAEAKAKADALARAEEARHAEADAKAEAKAKARAEADAKAKTEADLKLKAEARAKAEKAEQDAKHAAEVKHAEAKSAKPEDGQRAMAILEDKPSEARYLVQVAAVATQEKVDELQNKLKEAGIKSYTQKVTTPNGTLTRIRIGPFPNKEEAEKVRARLGKIGLSGSLATS